MTANLPLAAIESRAALMSRSAASVAARAFNSRPRAMSAGV